VLPVACDASLSCRPAWLSMSLLAYELSNGPATTITAAPAAPPIVAGWGSCAAARLAAVATIAPSTANIKANIAAPTRDLIRLSLCTWTPTAHLGDRCTDEPRYDEHG
jgi:hypothetical protein